MEFVIGIILIVSAVFLVIAVLFQSGKDHNLSGTITGGAESFFGKSKGKTIDRVLNRATAIVGVIFAVLVILCYIFQPGTTDANGTENAVSTETTVAETEVADNENGISANDLDTTETTAAPATTEAAETTAA